MAGQYQASANGVLVRSLSTRRILEGLVVVLLIGTIVGVAVLWPDGSRKETEIEQAGFSFETEAGTVAAVAETECPGGFAIGRCADVNVEVRSGPDAGLRVTLFMADLIPEEGDRVRLVATGATGADTAAGVPAYQFSDFERRQPMLILALIFAAAVIALARWRGPRASSASAQASS
ncbi:MAG: hypothetical protein ACR2OD_05580 [Gaiellaceae bacterium]